MPNATGERRERPDDYPLKRFVVDVLAANDGPLAVSALIETGPGSASAKGRCGYACRGW